MQLGKEELGVCFFKAPPAPGTKEAPGILFVGLLFCWFLVYLPPFHCVKFSTQFAEESELCSRTDGHSIYTELISNIDDLLSSGSCGIRFVLGHEISFHRGRY